MYTNPSPSQMLEAVVTTLRNQVLPEVQGANARTAAEMCLVVLACVAKRIPVEQQLCLQENREMLAMYADVVACLQPEGAAEARRAVARIQAVQGQVDVSDLASMDTLGSSHRQLSQAMIGTLDDLHALADSGNAAGAAALTRMRRHMGERVGRDFVTYFGPPQASSTAAGRA